MFAWLTWFSAQLTHSYYFSTHTLVLKFVNKGVFFEEIQDSHFPKKKGYFGTHLLECGEKGVNVDVQCFTVKRGFIWAEKSVFYCKRGGSPWTEKSVFYREKGVDLSWKVCLATTNGVIFKRRTRIGITFSSEWGSWGLVYLYGCLDSS